MNVAEIPFGGGVSLRFTRRPKGQSTVEYVLIIAREAQATASPAPPSR